MLKIKSFVVFISLFTFFVSSAESQTIEKRHSKKERKAKSSETNANGCGPIIATTIEREKPSDAASFVIYSFNSFFRKKKLIVDYNCPAYITSFVLNASEVVLNCPVGQTSDANNQKIEVSTEALDVENDPLTYEYYVSGGKIVGQGSRVVWDLSGEKPGVYTITVGVSDVWELSKTVTKAVKIIECANYK
jgi:hypothetical protein